jgi:hypothetical protein
MRLEADQASFAVGLAAFSHATVAAHSLPPTSPVRPNVLSLRERFRRTGAQADSDAALSGSYAVNPRADRRRSPA